VERSQHANRERAMQMLKSKLYQRELDKRNAARDKIEAGKMSINAERIYLKDFCNTLMRDFKHHADQKKIGLSCNIDNSCPESIHTDSQRLHQILKNLKMNYGKFDKNRSWTI